jgi:hypothetical protein
VAGRRDATEEGRDGVDLVVRGDADLAVDVEVEDGVVAVDLWAFVLSQAAKSSMPANASGVLNSPCGSTSTRLSSIRSTASRRFSPLWVKIGTGRAWSGSSSSSATTSAIVVRRVAAAAASVAWLMP